MFATPSQINVSCPLLKVQGLKLASELNIPEFKKSNTLLESSLRYNIMLKSTGGECRDVRPDIVNERLEKLPELINGYELANVTNMDETGWFYNVPY